MRVQRMLDAPDRTFVGLVAAAGLDPSSDLVAVDLRGLNLSRQDLSGFNFTRSHLARADLRDSLLVGARLEGADLTGALLQGADLTGATLTEAILNDCDLRTCRIDGRTAVRRVRMRNALVDVDAALRWLVEAFRGDGPAAGNRLLDDVLTSPSVSVEAGVEVFARLSRILERRDDEEANEADVVEGLQGLDDEVPKDVEELTRHFELVGAGAASREQV